MYFIADDEEEDGNVNINLYGEEQKESDDENALKDLLEDKGYIVIEERELSYFLPDSLAKFLLENKHKKEFLKLC